MLTLTRLARPMARPLAAAYRPISWGGLFGETPKGPIKVQSLAEARELEASGGAKDGKYKGQDIEIVGMGLYRRVEEEAQIQEGGPERVVVQSISEAQELDAKDGIIDGRIYGTSIEIQGVGLYSRVMHKVQEMSDTFNEKCGSVPDYEGTTGQDHIPPQLLMMQIKMLKEQKDAERAQQAARCVPGPPPPSKEATH